jgi:thioredoxin reductase (NADPH)
MLDGIFVAIGQKPENEPFASVTTLNDYGYIVSDESCVPNGASEGIFVAGDCRTKAVRQVATATADGATAALAACRLIDNF